MASYTIVVPDAETLKRMCGTNDSNLRLIENFLGESIYACGNELSIESENNQVKQQFDFIVNRILDEFGDNQNKSEDFDIVQSVLNVNQFKNQIYGEKKFSSTIEIPGSVKKIYPRTNGQCDLIHALQNKDVVFALGPAGCGKTFLAVAKALEMVLTHQVRKVVLTRPVVEAGESLGFLPGDYEEKINPYMTPFYDAINSILPLNYVKKLTENGIIEIAPLAYMRGRTLNDSVIILDEAQNTTKEQMKMFLTRMGENSKVFITGDITQIDLPKKIESGLKHAVSILGEVPEISIVNLTCEDVCRNNIVKKIIQAYENEEE